MNDLWKLAIAVLIASTVGYVIGKCIMDVI